MTHLTKNFGFLCLLVLTAGLGLGLSPERAFSGYADQVLADNPLAYFRLNETSGMFAVNEVEPARGGLYTPGVLKGQNSAQPIGTDPGNFYATFNGAISWITVDDQPAGQTADLLNFGQNDQFSVEMWLNIANSYGGNGNPFGKSNSLDQSNYFIHMGPATGNRLRWHTNGWAGNQEDSSTVLQSKTWYHVVVTYDGTVVDPNSADRRLAEIYINGVSDRSDYYLTSPGNTSGGDFFIGQLGQNLDPNTPGQDVFSGSIDELAIYGSVLNSERVLAHFNAAGSSAPVTLREWKNNQSGDWNEDNNWNPHGVPNGSFASVLFGTVSDSSRVVYTDTDVTVKGIQFLNSNTYAIVGTGTVHLNAGTSPDLSDLTVLLGHHQFQSYVAIHSQTQITVASNTSLTFNNTLDLGGNTVTKLGAGELAIRNTLATGAGLLNVQKGMVTGNGAIGGDVSNDGGTISPGHGVSASEVPEPATVVLLAFGLLALLGPRWL